MIDFNQVSDFISKLNTDAISILKKENENQQQISMEKARIESDSKKLKENMENALSDYEKRHFVSVKDKIQSLMDVVKVDYEQEYESSKIDENEFDTLAFSELQSKLEQIFDEINHLVEQLNSGDFDELVPPITVNSESESFTVVSGNESATYDCDGNQPSLRNAKPISDMALHFFIACKRGIYCIDTIMKSFRKIMELQTYNNHVDYSAKEWILEKWMAMQSERRNMMDTLFLSENAQNMYRQFFLNSQKDGEQYDVDIHAGTLDYKTAINIGNACLRVTANSEILKLFKQVPALNANIDNGRISIPVIMDLKKYGNILLEIDADDEYPQEVKNFVEQLIIQFLLSFPPNRINFRLIDIANKMGFSPFKIITKINTDILFDGIVRDDRKLEDVVKDMEQLMYDVEDNKLSYNNVEDVFEYNASFEANPQNIRLFVLVDYPQGLRDDLAQRILKIVQGGARNGIFTIIIHNKAVDGNNNYADENIQKFISAVQKKVICIRQTNSGLVLENISGDNIFTGKPEISTKLLPDIVEILRVNAERSKQKVVPLSQMFAETDRIASLPNGIPSSAAVLDIPIGVKGGEIQNLLLKTTGDGSAHAVVIGGTGSGKSNLLHTIIMNVCYKYSPDEVNLYMIDFKGGVEFKYYEANKVREKQLPHIKLTGLTSDLEDGVSILNNLQDELRRREDAFRLSNVEDIEQYRNSGNKMPRLFVIVDEIQELFEQDEKLGQKAIDILRELFKKGRAFGISILWASQNVPSAPGLKDKVLSQIGNRISLRLNEPEDALDIKIDPRVVRNLNRPEKGLGVINDIRYGNDSIEFRVAYAENSDNRQRYSEQILEKWRETIDASQQEPLFIVGNDDTPQPIDAFATPTRNEIHSKAFEDYSVQLGQNYITGKPYAVHLGIRENKSNLIIMGPDVEITRDLMGYSLLSVISEHFKNSDYGTDPAKIYYANGEIVSSKNSADLFNIARDDFADMIENISPAEKIKETVANLYKLYKDREKEADTASVAIAYTPVFLIIHSLQRYVDLFNSNPMLSIPSEELAEESPNSSDTSNFNMFSGLFAGVSSTSVSSTGQDKMVCFVDAVKEMMDRAGQFGIHFVVSVDSPESVRVLRDDITNTTFKVFTKGLDASTISQTMGEYGSSNGIHNPKVALVAIRNEKFKVRMYRYEDAKDSAWYRQFCSKLRALKG